MIKAIAACAAALVLAAGCKSNTTPASPQDSTIKSLASKLAPAMSCGTPRHSDTDTSVRVDCDSGRAFITAYPDAAGLRTELARTATISVGEDYLVGETWFAGANDPDGLARMKARLGGRVQHVGPTPMG